MSQPRRSSRIAANSKPSAQPESRAETESKKAMRKMLKELKEQKQREMEEILQEAEARRRANPLLFEKSEGGLHFVYDGWARQHYEPYPHCNTQYDLVRVEVSRDEHDGWCSDADEYDVYTNTVDLHFRKDEDNAALLQGMPPILMEWKVSNPNHGWCHAKIRYRVLSVSETCYSNQDEWCGCPECNRDSQEADY